MEGLYRPGLYLRDVKLLSCSARSCIVRLNFEIHGFFDRKGVCALLLPPSAVSLFCTFLNRHRPPGAIAISFTDELSKQPPSMARRSHVRCRARSSAACGSSYPSFVIRRFDSIKRSQLDVS